MKSTKIKFDKKNLLITILVIFLILILWGVYGGNQAQALGVTCDIGLGDNLCWKWHTNTLGDIGESISEIFD